MLCVIPCVVVEQLCYAFWGCKMQRNNIAPSYVNVFWAEAGRDKWFSEDAEFDKLVADKFLQLWQTALTGRLYHWCESDEGLLALTIVLDQFPRNIFRRDIRSFCSGRDARKVATMALNKGADKRIESELRGFFYLPFWNSENIDDQKKSIELFTQLGDEDLLQRAKAHYDLIGRFGRFPHRNKILGRRNNPAEQKFLETGILVG